MKKITSFYTYTLLALLLTCNTIAQVGVNTTDPKGVIDFNSSTMGVVYPNVALLSTDNPAPVVNPQGGPIVEGTVVYNTNSTNTGLHTDVFPGIYVWDGSEWIVHYKKRQSELYNQTTPLRTEANFALGYQDVPGLGLADGNTFTARYSGLYRIEVKTNFAGGKTETNNSIFVSLASGQFRFLFDGTANLFETSALSAYSSYINSGTDYEGVWKETYETTYVQLIAGQVYPFSLSFDAYDAPGFIGNGSTTLGGAITPVNFINENFEGPYTVDQDNVTDNDCWADGWIPFSTSYRCSSCSNRVLYIRSRNNGCRQNATAKMSFTPTSAAVNISFDYRFRDRTGKNDSFRVYLHDGTTQVGPDLVFIDNIFTTTTDSSFNGSRILTPGTTYTLRFEYINGNSRAYEATVDHVVVSGLSAPAPPSDEGRGYVGHEVDCQIEFTYIGE